MLLKTIQLDKINWDDNLIKKFPTLQKSYKIN